MSKYIITDQNEVFIGENTFHQILAKNAKGRVIRAGHVKFIDGRAEVFGESIGYNIKSQPEDARMIMNPRYHTTFV